MNYFPREQRSLEGNPAEFGTVCHKGFNSFNVAEACRFCQGAILCVYALQIPGNQDDVVSD